MWPFAFKAKIWWLSSAPQRAAVGIFLIWTRPNPLSKIPFLPIDISWKQMSGKQGNLASIQASSSPFICILKARPFFHRSWSDPCLPARETRWGRTSTQREMDCIRPQSTGACLSPDPIVHPYAGKKDQPLLCAALISLPSLFLSLCLCSRLLLKCFRS